MKLKFVTDPKNQQATSTVDIGTGWLRAGGVISIALNKQENRYKKVIENLTLTKDDPGFVMFPIPEDRRIKMVDAKMEKLKKEGKDTTREEVNRITPSYNFHLRIPNKTE